MTITYIRIDDLIPYAKNAKLHSDSQVARIAASIKEYGFVNPVLIDSDKQIIAGHGRVLAAMQLHMQQIPCVYADDLTDEQIRAFRLAENKTAELAGWDYKKLADEIRGFSCDLTEFGFAPLPDESMLDGLFDDDGNAEESKEGSKETREAEVKRVQCPYCGEWCEI